MVDVELERISDFFTALMQVLLCDFLLITIFVENGVVEFVDFLHLLRYASLQLFVRHTVCSSHRERVRHQPVVYNTLSDSHELVCGIRTDIQPNRVDQTTGTRTHHFFLESAREQLSLPDYHRGVISVPQAVLALPNFNCDLFGNDHAHDLLASPKRLWFEDCRHGKFSGLQLIVPLPLALLAVDPNDQVHHFFSGKEGVAHGEEIDAQQCILHDTHDRGVVLRGNDLLGDVGDVLQLRNGLVRLGNMHVHLVAVEVCIVWSADRQVESESVIRQNSDPVTHHTHAMESGLPVEKDVIAVFEISLDDHAVVEVFLDLVGLVVHFHEVYDVIVLFLVFGGLQNVFHLALKTQLHHSFVVGLSHLLRNGERTGNLLRNAQLVEGEIGVRTNHTSC